LYGHQKESGAFESIIKKHIFRLRKGFRGITKSEFTKFLSNACQFSALPYCHGTDYFAGPAEMQQVSGSRKEGNGCRFINFASGG